MGNNRGAVMRPDVKHYCDHPEMNCLRTTAHSKVFYSSHITAIGQ